MACGPTFVALAVSRPFKVALALWVAVADLAVYLIYQVGRVAVWYFVISVGDEKPFCVCGPKLFPLFLFARVAVCFAAMWAARLFSFIAKTVTSR